MKIYKHYSFDLWLTLIRSNPAFKEERSNYFHKRFNFSKKSKEEVRTIFRNVDLLSNRINEQTGKNLDTEEMYLMIISLINDWSLDFDSVDLVEIYADLEKLLFENSPVLYDEMTFEILEFLKKNTDSTISLLSNTGFVKGKTLRRLLGNLGIAKFFDFQIYSDEVGMSKPNPLIFQHLVTKVEEIGNNCALSEIIHIGDNPIADVDGARKEGIDALLINSNNKLINSIIS